MAIRQLDAGAKCPHSHRRAEEGARRDVARRPGRGRFDGSGSVPDFQGWVKTNKKALLKEQRTEKDETGRDVYVHRIERAS
jgi:hypothetical protein